MHEKRIAGRWFPAVLICLLAVVAYLFSSSAGTIQNTDKQRGVSWVAGREVSAEHIAQLPNNHVGWISQTPFGWQQDYNSTTLDLITTGVLWGETDHGLEQTTRLARAAGIKTLLKPHIWLRNRQNGTWRSDIAMDSEEDWQKWFASYSTFIMHYAQFAEMHGIEILCVGTELYQAIKQRPDDWRRMIAGIRKIYSGKLTYSANWYEEFEEVTFWDALDFIGVQAYFPLCEIENPGVEELVAGWRPYIERIEAVQRRYKRPVIFTEIGYRSSTDAAIKPWEWMHSSTPPDEPALKTQADCYEAFFRACWDKEWLAGCYVWKWFPEVGGHQSRRGRDLFTLQGNPAQQVVASWYRE